MSLAEKLSDERRARLAAERLLEQKQAELHAANRKLGRHARQLSEEIVETRAEVRNVRDENQRLGSEITAANEKVALAERRLWLSIQAIQDGFAFFDADGMMIGANAAWLSLFDGLEEVVPGCSYVRMLQLATEEGLINTGDEPPAAWRARMIDRWQDAAPMPEVIRLFNDRFIRLITHRGHGGDVVNIAMDITKSVRYQARLREARERAEAANRAKSAFLANMSHEIRTPMNGVVGMAELLCDTDLTEDQKLYADTIRNSGEALLVIINDVLDYSKIEADKLDLHPRPFDLERCLHEVVTLLMPSARDKGLTLHVDYDVFLPTLFVGDQGRLRQILLNLIGNAVKFTAQGHVLVRVVGLPESGAGRVRLHVTVEDTGIGIPADKIALIFEEFSQVQDDRARAYEGTGLGLAISRRLIELMEGRLWVDSEEGRGSAFGFAITLPVAEGEVQDDSALPDLRLGRVLIVDDTEMNRTILSRQVEALGGTAICAASGAAALDALRQGADLMLTDHNMPDMDGLELVQAMRDAGHDVPVIMLSSNPGYADMDPARRHLAALLQRPTPRRVLFDALADLSPRAAVEPEEETGPMPTFVSRRHPPPEGRTRLRILAAEDNPTNRMVLERMIASADIDLRFAEDGEAAVQAWRDDPPDLILMDISMPRLDGTAATARIRAEEAATGRHVPIVAMTAHALDGDEDQFLSTGIDAYIPKPIRRDAVLAMIDRFRPLAGATADPSAAPDPEAADNDPPLLFRRSVAAAG